MQHDIHIEPSYTIDGRIITVRNAGGTIEAWSHQECENRVHEVISQLIATACL
jgi:hypothetical protein